MKKINAVIVDDEPMARMALKAILNNFFKDVEVVGEADSPSTAIDLLLTVKPDLCFLDVEMPPGNGFDVLEGLGKVDFKVIFVTAHTAQAYRSFRVDALDYLIKPIRISELRSALEKYRFLEAKAPVEQPLVSDHRNPVLRENQIVVPASEGYLVLEIQDIVRCEATKNYTFVYLTNGKVVTASKSLNTFEELLEPVGFIRIHRSHIVNLAMIAKFSRGRNTEITMKDDTVIPVARERKQAFFKVFLNGALAGEADDD